jgi:CSLREA domain-containing protein
MTAKTLAPRLRLLAGSIAVLLSTPVLAGGDNVLTVTTLVDAMDAFDQQCSLREALHNANTNTLFSPVVSECAPGSSAAIDVLLLASGATYDLTLAGAGDDAGDLDVLNGSTLIDGSPDLRIEVTGGTSEATIRQMVANQRVMDVRFEAGLALTNVILRGGTTDSAGGGIASDGSIALTNVTLIGNSANSGGGLYNAGFATLIDSQVLVNSATFVGGGGIFNANGSVTLIGTTVRGNTGTDGAGIYRDAGADLTVSADSFVNLNIASGDGGGIYSLGEGDLQVSDSTFEGNSATKGGGLYHESASDVFFTANRFIGNSATHGGGVRVELTAELYVDGGLFESNTATGDGGAISGFTVANDAVFRLNTANRGGAAHASLTVNARDSSFSENNAVHGGAIHAQFVRLTDTTVSDNQAQMHGGGIRAGELATLDRVRVINNGAQVNGGGLYVGAAFDGVSIINRSLFSGNGTLDAGGGIWVNNPMTLTNTTISGNFGDGGGAGLYIADEGDVTARYVTIANHEGSNGIAKYGNLTLGNSIISTAGEDDCVVGLKNPEIVSLGFNRADDASCLGLDELTDVTSVDVMIGALADNGGGTLTHALLPGSPAINVGPATCADAPVSGVDQRGAARPVSLGCDSGAFEAGAVPDDGIFADGFED